MNANACDLDRGGFRNVWPGKIGNVAVTLCLLCVLIATIAIPAVAKQDAGTGVPITATYRLRPGDILDVTVMGKAELSREIAVRPDGVIAYPYLGEINVLGLTLRQVTDRLVEGLSRQISRPQVTVNIARRQQLEASVLGAVHSPGKRILGDGWHVLDLLADAGGLAVERPEWASATLVRGAGAQAIPLNLTRILATGDPSQNIAIEPGDVLLVQQVDVANTHIQVLGEVDKPGFVPAPRDGSLATVLLAVGGPTQHAALARASIVRHSSEGTSEASNSTIAVDLSHYPIDGTVPDNVRVQPGDTLIIPQNRKIYSVLGAVQRPGTVSYPENQSVTALTALTLAGGNSGDADLQHGALIRPNAAGGDPTIIPVNLERLLKNEKPTASHASPPAPPKAASDNAETVVSASADNPIIEPGDLLFVPSRSPRRSRFGLQDALNVLPLISLFRL